MNFLKLNSNQYIELMPRCKCSVRAAIDDAIEFVKAHELDGADLLFEGFTFGIYPDQFKNRESQFAHKLELEFNNWKSKQP
ncbi:MAG: hypothetical protein JNL03_08480 [Prolixibacteraceae bacterium]|nr:hypothetical protein [Prolixibacteraceae bacterium]